MNTQKRAPELDLIRCIAMLLVVTYHSFLYNNYYYEPQNGTAMWLAGSVRYFSMGCNGLFLMLSGYLRSEKTDLRSCYRNLTVVIISYLLACFISIPVRHFCMNDPHSFTQWITSIFKFDAVYYGWYVEMYLGLCLLMPFINILLQRLRTTKMLLYFTAVILVLSAMPGALPAAILPDFWKDLYPITYFVLGAVIRRLKPKAPIWLGILCAAVLALLMGANTLLSTNENLFYATTWNFEDIWVVLIALCLFVSLYQIRVPSQLHGILAFGAKGCFCAYLLSHLLDGWCYYQLRIWITPKFYIFLFIFATIPIYFTSLLAGNLLQKCVDFLAKYLRRPLNALPSKPLDSLEDTPIQQ